MLTNAARYTPPGGRIAVRAKREAAEVVIDVTDTGIGISADLLPRVFDLFVQGARPIDRSEGGLGLGLALVRNLVELHGGTTSAHSAGRGLGSTFTVRLPALDAELATSREEITMSSSAARSPARRILVVDDNRDAAEMLAEMLATVGHQVVVAHDGPEALVALESYDPDLAILDIGLPAMDGYELARRIHNRGGRPKLRLLAMTGYGQADDVAKSREAGFAEHLVKPVDVRAVIAAIDRTEPV